MDRAESKASNDDAQIDVPLEDWSKYSAQAADKAANSDLPPVEFFDSKQLSGPSDFQKFMESQNKPKEQTPIEKKYDQSNITAAIDASIKNGVPMVVHTGATWCGPCRNMEANVWPKIEESFKGKAAFTHLDIDKVNDPAEKVAAPAKKLIEGITGVPNIKVVMPEKQKDGSIKFKVLEEVPTSMTLERTRQLVDKWTKKPERK